ncbi:hypothetical protein Q3G72_017290 [Acer saccharum]|nr:hypothetical protein Q3G72_032110 [Acer saccharum]KAK1587838.1 hypothetical protein Q3G72_017290 [Acer saccharum]
MEITSTTAFISSLVTIAIAWMLMSVVNWVWLKPKKLEKWLRQQGFSGNSYRLFHGDMKDMSEMRKQAKISKPINLSDSYVHNIVPRILPFQHHINTIYGKKKIANPAFHQHKLKDMFPSIYWSCNEMISKWKILDGGFCLLQQTEE